MCYLFNADKFSVDDSNFDHSMPVLTRSRSLFRYPSLPASARKVCASLKARLTAQDYLIDFALSFSHSKQNLLQLAYV
ncbi:MAG: hypothetical protein EBY55_10795 [Gammaproteobacteria bacterium]|nr:hypothetical protein [Gammaproteobacteria bacterium]